MFYLRRATVRNTMTLEPFYWLYFQVASLLSPMGMRIWPSMEPPSLDFSISAGIT